jgi:hypothetical protein
MKDHTKAVVFLAAGFFGMFGLAGGISVTADLDVAVAAVIFMLSIASALVGLSYLNSGSGK